MQMRLEAMLKVFPVLSIVGSPRLLHHCQGTREHHELHSAHCGNKLSPDIRLNTLDQLELLGTQVGRDYVRGIDALERIVILPVIEVAIGSGTDDHLIAHLGGFLGHISMITTPPVYCGCAGNATLEYLVPSHQLTAMLIEESFHVLGKPCLQFGHIPQFFLGNTLLAVGTAYPSGTVHLISSYVGIFIGKELEYLLPDITTELQSQFLAQA